MGARSCLKSNQGIRIRSCVRDRNRRRQAVVVAAIKDFDVVRLLMMDGRLYMYKSRDDNAQETGSASQPAPLYPPSTLLLKVHRNGKSLAFPLKLISNFRPTLYDNDSYCCCRLGPDRLPSRIRRRRRHHHHSAIIIITSISQ